MKKLLALVLALIMVLGLGVTAFADTLKVIDLIEEDDDDDDDPDVIGTLDLEIVSEYDKKTNEKVYLVSPKGDDYYVEIGEYDDLKNIEVATNGIVSAEIVEFDADTMRYPGAVYAIYDSEQYGFFQANEKLVLNNGKFAFNNQDAINALLTAGFFGNYDLTKLKTQNDFQFDEEVDGSKNDVYSYLDYVAKKLNAIKDVKKNRFSVVCLKEVEGDAGNYFVKLDKHLLKITVEDNYTAAYKESSVKLSAYNKNIKEDVVATLTIVSDVIIFEYDEFNWAVEEGEALQLYTEGYSDYKTAKHGYGDEYDADELREYPGACVVSTTEWKGVEGEDLTIAADFDAKGNPKNYIEIKEIAKGQKGVNFAFEDYKYYDKDDEKLATGKLNTVAKFDKVKGDVKYVTFGFLGNQVINSDFTIYLNPDITYYQLRELFGKKVEEEDVITYYVLKDGVKIDDFTVDYANDEIDDPVELEILGKAGDKLGFYTLTLDAPAAEEGEENPNTGAESVVGVVAAMAVVSLVAAAAVSLKK